MKRWKTRKRAKRAFCDRDQGFVSIRWRQEAVCIYSSKPTLTNSDRFWKTGRARCVDHNERIMSRGFESFIVRVLGNRAFSQQFVQRRNREVTHWPLGQEMVDLGFRRAEQRVAFRVIEQRKMTLHTIPWGGQQGL